MSINSLNGLNPDNNTLFELADMNGISWEIPQLAPEQQNPPLVLSSTSSSSSSSNQGPSNTTKTPRPSPKKRTVKRQKVAVSSAPQNANPKPQKQASQSLIVPAPFSQSTKTFIVLSQSPLTQQTVAMEIPFASAPSATLVSRFPIISQTSPLTDAEWNLVKKIAFKVLCGGRTNPKSNQKSPRAICNAMLSYFFKDKKGWKSVACQLGVTITTIKRYHVACLEGGVFFSMFRYLPRMYGLKRPLESKRAPITENETIAFDPVWNVSPEEQLAAYQGRRIYILFRKSRFSF